MNGQAHNPAADADGAVVHRNDQTATHAQPPLNTVEPSASRPRLSTPSQVEGARPRMQIRSSIHRGARDDSHAHPAAGRGVVIGREVDVLSGQIGEVGARSAAGRFPSPNPLFAGCPSLFLQTACATRHLSAAAALVAVEETGLLLTLNPRMKDRIKELRRVVSECRVTIAAAAPADASAQPVRAEIVVLADANRYAGKNRAVATATGSNLDPAWVAVQRELGLSAALTDSPYVPAEKQTALAAVLDEARALGPDVVAVLPLHLDWLKKDVASLIAEINKAAVPVALVLEHDNDPLGVQDAVAGLVRLLAEAEVKIALLRCDISVIGAVAFGASLGAVGTTTALRHLYPTKEKGGGFNGGARIGIYVPRSMAYRALDTLNTAIALDQEHQERWICGCHRCFNRPLSHIHDEVAAYQHSLTAIAELGQNILDASSPLHRQHAWVGQCNHAQVTNMEIAAETGLNWDPPKFQGAWHKLAPSLPPLS